jgi:hypothetical protein
LLVTDSNQQQSEPGQAYWPLLEPIWRKVEIHEGSRTFLKQFAAAPVPNRTLLAAHWCQSEVCNGGFEQFFYNGTGVLAPEAEVAFEDIGMPLLASITRRAIDLFPAPYPRRRVRRWQDLKAISTDALDTLDDEFYAQIKTEAGGFEAAADAYAVRAKGGLPDE